MKKKTLLTNLTGFLSSLYFIYMLNYLAPYTKEFNMHYLIKSSDLILNETKRLFSLLIFFVICFCMLAML